MPFPFLNNARLTNPIAGLPSVSGTQVAVYGTSRLITGYNGALFRLKRIADNVTMDIFPQTANNLPNVSGVLTFLNGAAQCRVDTVYDQLGSGNNITQATNANMPFFALTNQNGTGGVYSVTFDGNQNNATFSIPAAITGNGQSTSIVTVTNMESTAAPAIALLGANLSTAGIIAMRQGAAQVSKMDVWTSAHFGNVANVNCRTQPAVNIIASGASATNAYLDGLFAKTQFANTAGTWVGGTVGSDTNAFFYGEMFAVIIYSGQLTISDAGILQPYLSNLFNCQSVRPNTQLVLTGNSIVQGTKATRLFNNPRQAEPLYSRPIFTRNNGIFGQLAGTVHTGIANTTAQFSALFVNNLAIIIEPTNDIEGTASGNIAAPSTAGGGGSGSVGTNVWNNWTAPDIATLQAAGFKVLVPTTLNRAWSGSAQDVTDKTNAQGDWNTLARAATGVTLLDYQAIPNLANPGNTTFFADGVHPTTAGYALMAQLLSAGVNSLI